MPLSVIVACIAGESEGTIHLGRRDSFDPQLVLVISRRRAVAPVDDAWGVAGHVSIGAVARASVGDVRRSHSAFPAVSVERRISLPNLHRRSARDVRRSTTGGPSFCTRWSIQVRPSACRSCGAPHGTSGTGPATAVARVIGTAFEQRDHPVQYAYLRSFATRGGSSPSGAHLVHRLRRPGPRSSVGRVKAGHLPSPK
jgi:hypothetical protein